MTDLIAQIDRELDAGNVAGAARIAEQALQAGSKEPIVYNLAAWQREEEGRFEEAEALILDAQTRDPEDPTLFVALGVVRRKQGHLKAAVDAIEQAIRLDPGYAGAWQERATTFEKGGAIADAAADFRHALSLEPGNAGVMASLASINARQGNAQEATALAEAALRIEPDNLGARNALAQVALEAKRFDEAISLLEATIRDHPDARDVMIHTRTLLGDALEGAGRYDEAYASYQAAQKLFQEVHANRPVGEGQGGIPYLTRVADEFAQADKTLWHNPVESGQPPVARHVFLTGYPRSGTTLTENILASLPNALAIEERPTLGMMERSYLSRPGGLARLGALDGPELAELRADYWARVERAADQNLAGKLFVDMDPFKGPRLPAIAKMFPQAKVIITRRDPRDVIWSCFHTSFAYNAGTASFASLESTARHYAASWTIAEQALETLPIDWFELRYEELVRNFDDTTRALCNFLEVPWTEDVRRFDRTAQRRGVSTASATQVRQGLYDGSGGWRRYEKYIATVQPILQPWIERFGYE